MSNELSDSILRNIRKGFADDHDECIGFRRLTEFASPGRVRTIGWEFFGRKSVLTLNRDGLAVRTSSVHGLSKFPDEFTSDAYTGITNADRRIEDHPILNTERVYRAWASRHVPDGNSNGVVVIGDGMTCYVTAAFHDWNGVPGLDMLYVNVRETSCRTHVTPADLGWTEPLLP